MKTFIGLLTFCLMGIAQAQTITPSKSLLITDHKLLNRLNPVYDFGYLMGQLNTWNLEVAGPASRQYDGRPAALRSHGAFIEFMFSGALKEQNDHEQAPLAKRLGDPIKSSFKMDAVFRNWKSSSEMRNLTTLNSVKGGPFRLLAIVNLMDRAGDMVFTSPSVATATPKSLGEIHLVYGLIDKAYESSTGEPFPQTLVLAYKLPPLQWSGGVLVPDPSVSHESLMSGDFNWRYKLMLWGNLWAKLSEHDIGSAQFESQLRQIIDLSVRPENFLSLRSNVKVNSSEFELREWYTIMTTQLVIPKKPRDEPYRCFSGSSDLTRAVNEYWRSTYSDLDVTTYDPLLDEYRGQGYQWPRDNETGPYAGQWLFPSCGSNKDNYPFEMYDPGGGVIPDSRIVVTAPFARTPVNRVWKLANGAPEERRHAFAIRTCSGCHSVEGATSGFHIFPRLEFQNSKLSPFLTGAAGNTFTYGGRTYSYDILKARKEWLVKAINREAKIGDSLMRPEMPH